MPVTDIVIDTNIFVHAENPKNCYCTSSCSLITKIMSSDIYLCIDDVFDPIEAKNTSRIGSEYFQHVRSGTQGYILLLYLISKDRIKQVFKKDLDPKFKTYLSKSRIKAGDKVFLNVTRQSTEKLLVSNDYADFTSGVRNTLVSDFNLTLMDSDEVVAGSVV